MSTEKKQKSLYLLGQDSILQLQNQDTETRANISKPKIANKKL